MTTSSIFVSVLVWADKHLSFQSIYDRVTSVARFFLCHHTKNYKIITDNLHISENCATFAQFY